jgi:hypothetical protein
MGTRKNSNTRPLTRQTSDRVACAGDVLRRRLERFVARPEVRAGKRRAPDSSNRVGRSGSEAARAAALQRLVGGQGFAPPAVAEGGGVAGVVGCVAAGRAGSLPEAGGPGRVGCAVTSFFSTDLVTGAGPMMRAGAVRWTGCAR